METKNPAPRYPQAAAHWMRRAPVKGRDKTSFILCTTKRGPRIPSKRRSHAHATCGVPPKSPTSSVPTDPSVRKKKGSVLRTLRHLGGLRPQWGGTSSCAPGAGSPPYPPSLPTPNCPLGEERRGHRHIYPCTGMGKCNCRRWGNVIDVGHSVARLAMSATS